MKLLDITLYLVVLLPFGTTDSIINEKLRFKQMNLLGTRRSKSFPKREQKSLAKSPVEYTKTPNYDVIFLSEEHSNPICRQYADHSQPNDFHNVQRIEQLHKKSSTHLMRSDMMDPTINQILEVLRKADQKMIEDLKEKFEGKSSESLSEKRMYSSGYDATRKWTNFDNQNGNMKNKYSSIKSKDNSPVNDRYKDPWNEGYVFLLQNQENLMDPDVPNDLLLRVLKIVTKTE